jgi:hypothetical protein
MDIYYTLKSLWLVKNNNKNDNKNNNKNDNKNNNKKETVDDESSEFEIETEFNFSKLLNQLSNIFSIDTFKSLSLGFSSPVHIIDNIYIGNEYNAANYSIIRDYNFKFILNLSDNIPNYFENDITYFKQNFDINTIDTNILIELVDKIVELQSIDDYKSEKQIHILIHADTLTNNKTIIIIMLLLNYKYNFNLKKIYKLFKKTNKNIKIDDTLINKINLH